MNKLDEITRVLQNKLEEWGNNQGNAMILVDSFMELMDALGYDEDTRLKLLETIQKSYTDDGYYKHLYKVLEEEILCIKINWGY